MKSMGTETALLPAFFKISSFVFHRKKESNTGLEGREGEQMMTCFAILFY